jgi:hypothetical protein
MTVRAESRSRIARRACGATRPDEDVPHALAPLLLSRALREHRYQCSLQACSLPLQGWGLIDLPLRASNEGLLRPRVARAQKIDQPPSHSLFREQEDDQAVLPLPISTLLHSSLLRTLRSFRRSPLGRFPNTRLFESVCRDAEGLVG